MEVPEGLSWRIYSINENTGEVLTYDNFSYLPSEVPTTGVIAINQLVDNRRDTDRITGADNYLYIEGQSLWTGSDDLGVTHRDGAGTSYVRIYGLWTPTPLYQRAMAEVIVDSDFPNALDKDSMGSLETSLFNARFEQEKIRRAGL